VEGVPLRLHAGWVVARREIGNAASALGGYVAIATALLAAGWIVSNDIRAARAADLLVLEHPFRSAVTVAVLVISLFLGVSAVVSVARERDRGTLEVLFYGPVDEVSYLGGKLLGQVGGYLVALPILLAGLLMLSFLTGLSLTGSVILGMVASVVPAGLVVAFGLLLAVIGGRLRNAVLLFVTATLAMVAVSVAYRFLLTVPIGSATSPLLPIRDAIGAMNAVVEWISPFATLERTVDGIAIGAWASVALSLLVAGGYTLVSLLGAAAILRRRGIRSGGE